ncbi:hypothetical protein KR074_004013, partial [Drosophila pseudoananassae]
MGCSRYTKNEDLRLRYNIKTLEEIYLAQCERFATCLLTHENPVVRNLGVCTFIPIRTVKSRPRYVKHVETHILANRKKFKGLTVMDSKPPT